MRLAKLREPFYFKATQESGMSMKGLQVGFTHVSALEDLNLAPFDAEPSHVYHPAFVL
jgi:hypothetical protein